MDFVDTGTMTKIIGILHDATFRKNLCNCDYETAVVFRIDKVLDMGVHSITADCSVVSTSGCMLTFFWGHDLTAKKCEHQQVTTFRTKFSDDQWKSVGKQQDLMIAVGAKFQNGFLDLSPLTCALMPFHRLKHPNSVANDIVVAELFSGGFSGWTHGVKSLIGQGVNLHHRWAVDRDPDCIEAYNRSHSPDLIATSPQKFWSEFGELNEGSGLGREHILIHSAIGDRWWLTAFPESVDLFVASPPCPPWAITNSSPGFSRSDGLTFAHMVAYIAWIRPKIVIIENIATIVRHPHWKIIVALFHWAGYNIRGHHNLNLLDHVPQRRDRMILIATDARSDFDEHHIFDKWPINRPLSLKSYDAIVDDSECWQDYTNIDANEMKLYNDVSLFPRDSTVSGHAKRSRRDLHQYRFRDENSHAACFMTSYGRPSEVKGELLEQGGLYGSLLVQGNKVRKFSLPEIIILQGTSGPCWVSKNIRQAMKILGNCISLPHALWGLINGLFFLPEFPKDIMPDVLFSRCLANHLTASNIAWESVDGGFRFFFRQDAADNIPQTQPILNFIKVDIKCVTQEYELFCQENVDIHSVIRCVTGASIPQIIDMHLNGDKTCAIPLYENNIAKSQNVVLHTNVPSRLLVSETCFRSCSHSSPVVSIFTPNGIVAVPRFVGMKIKDLPIILYHCNFIDNLSEGMIFQNHLGNKWSLDDSCPDCIIAINLGEMDHRKQLDHIQSIRFQYNFQTFVSSADRSTIQDLILFLDYHGLRQAIQAFGWNFSIMLSVATSEKCSLVLAPKPGCLSMPCESMKSFIILRAFAAHMEDISRSMLSGIPEAYEYEYAFVQVKFGDDYIWQGELPKVHPLQLILDAWNFASNLFYEESPIRLVIDGKNFNPEFSLASLFPRYGRVVKIHLMYPLHGGGVQVDSNAMFSSEEFHSEGQTDRLCRCDFVDLTWINMESESFDGLVSHVLKSMLPSNSKVETCYLDHFCQLSLQESDRGLFVLTTFQKLDVNLHCIRCMGLDIVLAKLGWALTIDFAFDAGVPIPVLHLVPLLKGGMNDLQSCSRSLIRSVLSSALFVYSMPLFTSPLANPVNVKLKLWNTWIYHGLIDGSSPVGILIDLWNKVMNFTGSDIALRIISRGKRVNPDRSIQEYVDPQHSHGVPEIKFMLITGLTGGGKPAKTEDSVKAKNALATFLLERGADLQTTSVFTEKVVTSAGQQAIHHVLQIQQPGAKLSALKKLADTLVLKLPEMNHAESQRKATVQRKIKAQQLASHTPHPSEFRLQEDFFLNQDGSPCKQIETIQAGSSGVALMTAHDAVPWLQTGNHISQDELAALVLGVCPCVNSDKCQRIIVPAYDRSNKPVLLAACLHNLGQQQLKIQEVSKAADVAVSSTTVCAITAFRDELDQSVWNQLLESPVKVCFEVLQQAGCSLTLPCAPWGRSWRSSQGQCAPAVADSFQVHIRIPWAKKDALLKTSGISGIYVTPKAEDHKLDDGFAIVWLDKSLGEIKVLAASCPKHYGLVKLVKSKGKRINRGLRFVKTDFPEMHAHLKPGIDPPLQLTCQHFGKIAPTPIGAMFDEVQAWLIEVDWQAKPIKPLGSDAWMIGAPVRFEAEWASWNNQLLLLTWFPPKGPHHTKVVVAGLTTKKPGGQNSHNSNQSEPNQVDPWANYVYSTGRVLDSDKRPTDPSKVVSAVPRSITGPIEERFQTQDNQISELKSTLHALTGRIDHQEQSQTAFKHDVKKEFDGIRGEMTQQCQQLASMFEETLNRSLRRQDQQLSDSFTELKALFTDRVVPAKKAKMTKPPGEEEGS